MKPPHTSHRIFSRFLCGFRLSPRCEWDLPYFAVLHSVKLLVSYRSFGTAHLSHLQGSTLEDWTCRLSRNVGGDNHYTLRKIPEERRSRVSYNSQSAIVTPNVSTSFRFAILLGRIEWSRSLPVHLKTGSSYSSWNVLSCFEHELVGKVMETGNSEST